MWSKYFGYRGNRVVVLLLMLIVKPLIVIIYGRSQKLRFSVRGSQCLPYLVTFVHVW